MRVCPRAHGAVFSPVTLRSELAAAILEVGVAPLRASRCVPDWRLQQITRSTLASRRICERATIEWFALADVMTAVAMAILVFLKMLLVVQPDLDLAVLVACMTFTAIFAA